MYTNKDKIENYIMADISSAFEDSLNDWIEEVQRFIDVETGTTFESEEREIYYNGNGKMVLFIDDFQSIDEVTVNGSEVSFTAGRNKPIYKITTKDGFPKGFDNVMVKGEYGFSEEAPKDIEMAATILVSKIINKHFKSKGDIKSEGVEDYNVDYDIKDLFDGKAERIVNKYKKIV